MEEVLKTTWPGLAARQVAALPFPTAEVPQYDFHNSVELESVVLETFDALRATVPTAPRPSGEASTVLLRVLQLGLVELRQPEVLQQMMVEYKTPSGEHSERLVAERDRTRLVVGAIHASVFASACLVIESMSNVVDDGDVYVRLLALRCMVSGGDKVSFGLSVKEALMGTSHEELRQLRFIARDSIQGMDNSSQAFGLEPSPSIRPLSTNLANDLLPCACSTDGYGSSATIAEKQCIAALGEIGGHSGGDERLTVRCVAIGRLVQVAMGEGSNIRCLSLLGHTALSLLATTASVATTLSDVAFASLCPLTIQLLKSSSLSLKSLGCLLLRRLLCADSTMLTSAAPTVLPPLWSALSCCDESVEWSGVSLALSRCLHSYLAAASNSALATSYAHEAIQHYSYHATLAQSFKTLWVVGTAMHCLFPKLHATFGKLHSAQLVDVAVTMLNTWHLPVQRYGLWLLHWLLQTSAPAEDDDVRQSWYYPHFKVLVELARCFLFYSDPEQQELSGAPLGDRSKFLDDVSYLAREMQRGNANAFDLAFSSINKAVSSTSTSFSSSPSSSSAVSFLQEFHKRILS